MIKIDRFEICDFIKSGRVIAVLRAGTADDAWNLMRAYVDAGVKSIEITTTVPGWAELIEKADTIFGGAALIGLGTVTTSGDAIDAIDAGAKFIVSPYVASEAIVAASSRDVPVIPGALTPSEIARAYELGADMVKVFPASSVGGPKYLKALLAPMPHWELVPTGGVTPENTLEYFLAGAKAVGLGSNLAPKDALLNKDWNSVTKGVQKFLADLYKSLGESEP